MAKKEKKAEAEVLGFLAVGLDNEDGHQRITNNENFVLLGGSAETHEKMQDVSIHFNEELSKRGKRLQDAEPDEAIDMLRDAIDH